MRPPLPPGPYLVVGLARSGLSAARLLHARGETVAGTDLRAPAAAGEEPFAVHTGTDGLELLGDAAAVVKSPGVPPSAPLVAAARAAGFLVLGEFELSWRLIDAPFVAVTGTNGKTTVTEWIGHVHRTAGVPVAVAGNVGTPLSSLPGTLDAGTTVVCECSSYQLHDTLAFAPEVGVLLNLGSDHLNWHGSVEAYRTAKLEGMFSRQGPLDVAILPDGVDVPGDAEVRRWAAEAVPDELGLPGPHNRANAQAVAAACRARGLPEDAVREGLRTFRGVEHRLEDAGVRDGVRFVNDSKATNVESTLVALAAIDAPVHLILGGDDAKQEDFAPLRAPVEARAAGVYLIGQAAERLREALGRGERCGDLEHAVAAARAAARPGEVVLLSPACASFDQYPDFEVRGRHFKALVEESPDAAGPG